MIELLKVLFLTFLAMFLASVIHELSHFVVAIITKQRVEEISFGQKRKLIGVKIKGIEVNLRTTVIAGYIRFDDNEYRNWVFVAGGIVNIITAILTWILFEHSLFVTLFTQISFVSGVLNLLPFFDGSDGKKVYENFLKRKAVIN